MNRREFLKLSGAGFLAMTFGGQCEMRNAQCVMNYDNEIFSSRRIDFHAHAILPSYIDALKRLHIDAAAEEGFPLPKWSVENHLQFMADAGIDFTILSPATPHISDCKSARAINEDFAGLCRRFPEKFGFAATLPLPNVEGSIEEFHYATEKLGALGVKVASNSDGVYLGDKRLEPIFAALNEKKFTRDNSSESREIFAARKKFSTRNFHDAP